MKNYITPWLTIWFRPVETVERILNTKHCKFILLFIFSINYIVFFIITFLPLRNTSFYSFKNASFMYITYMLIILFITLFLFLITKAFKGKASYRELLVVIVLSLIPYLISNFLDYLNIYASWFSFYIALWGTMLFIVMFSYVEKISAKKIFFIFTTLVALLGLFYIVSIKLFPIESYYDTADTDINASTKLSVDQRDRIMVILEKKSEFGLHRVEIEQPNDKNTIVSMIYLNNALISNEESISNNKDALYKSKIKEYIQDGYLEVEKATTYIQKEKKSVERLSFKEFKKKYPNVNMSRFLNNDYYIDVYMDDAVIDGDLDLKTGFGNWDRYTNKVYLKNVTVKGSVYSQDVDTDVNLIVLGNLYAENLLLNGPSITIYGEANISNVCLVLDEESAYSIAMLNALVYVVEDGIYYANIKNAKVDYALYFDYELYEAVKENNVCDEEENLYKKPFFYKGEKETWINKKTIPAKILPFFTSEKILKLVNRITKDLSNLDEN